jgi:hypothetical protein
MEGSRLSSFRSAREEGVIDQMGKRGGAPEPRHLRRAAGDQSGPVARFPDVARVVAASLRGLNICAWAGGSSFVHQSAWTREGDRGAEAPPGPHHPGVWGNWANRILPGGTRQRVPPFQGRILSAPSRARHDRSAAAERGRSGTTREPPGRRTTHSIGLSLELPRGARGRRRHTYRPGSDHTVHPESKSPSQLRSGRARRGRSVRSSLRLARRGPSPPQPSRSLPCAASRARVACPTLGTLRLDQRSDTLPSAGLC